MSHGIEVERHDDPACAFIFERLDKALDDGDTAVFADGPETCPDLLLAAPDVIGMVLRLGARLCAGRPELGAIVGDHVLGLAVMPCCLVDDSNGVSCARLTREDGEGEAFSRIMVQYHKNPPAERPALR